MSITGSLYVVATPIGNLGDISLRALEVLRAVRVIACEDTRHSTNLLYHYDIGTSRLSFHEHNERQQSMQLLSFLKEGDSVALISDAGTPLLSDPGYYLVRLAQQHGIKIIPLPGPNAALAALSVSGLSTRRFVFEGFLPSREKARYQQLEMLYGERRTLVFYEAPHRLLGCLRDMVQVFGDGREAVLARELTKSYETIRRGKLSELLAWVEEDPNQQRGEIVLVVHGSEESIPENEANVKKILELLLKEVPLKRAVALAAKISGQRKNRLYDIAIQLVNGKTMAEIKNPE